MDPEELEDRGIDCKFMKAFENCRQGYNFDSVLSARECELYRYLDDKPASWGNLLNEVIL